MKKKMCAEFNMDEKNCAMTVDDNKVECDNFSIGSYSFLDSEGKKCKASYAAFTAPDEDMECSYMISLNHATGETLVTKSGMKILSSLKDNVDIINLTDKITKAFFNKEPYATITIEQLISDVFKMHDVKEDIKEPSEDGKDE